jgi:Tfp pilus assembly protein PilX
MNKQTKPHHLTLLQFMLRVQQLARQDPRSDEGYAMMIVSIVTILIFSMLGAYLTITNLSKFTTNAYIDGSNTFYAAESGLNRRASQVREKFEGYVTPSGTSPGSTTSVTSANIANCFAVSTTTSVTANDFECRNYSFRYNNNAATTKDRDGKIVVSDVDNNSNSVNYTAYTFVADRTNYSTTSNPPAPVPQTIPAGQTYAGLNALEYIYTVYATAAKPDPTNPTQAIQSNDAKTVLQMNFRSRVIPLFQFAAFYNEDLEMTSTSTMTLSGRVHTNGNFYIQPTPLISPAAAAPAGITTYFYSPVTSAGNIYNRNDAAFFLGLNRYAPPRVLQSGNPFTNTPAPIYYPDNSFRADMTAATPLDATEINNFGAKIKDGNAGAAVLNIPDPGFLRKRNYVDNQVGEYYAKADMRLELVPDRDVTSKTTTPIWTRNPEIIPFNFTSIQTGGAGVCTTTAPAAGSDPAANYIDPKRINASMLKCNVFTKGQLQSLRQPVLVWTHLNQSNAAIRPTEETTLGKPTTLPTPPTLSSSASNDKILRALQVAIVSTPTPIAADRLDTAIASLPFGTEFSRLINTIAPPLSNLDKNNLLAASPNQIAALQGAWFLPAPIQRVENNQPAVQIAENPRSSGFYDGRERRWITMLQTNIRSLSVWNRDGLYVEADNQTMTTPYTAANANQDLAFNNGTGANLTDGFAFARQAAPDLTKPIGTLPYLGLGSTDTTEGGLVLHATVKDDLDGNGVIVAANDVVADSTDPIYKRDSITNLDTTAIVDYPRKYLNGTKGQSPFGFAFNGGDYLPGALTLATDQAIYVQGNFNNNANVQPAAAVNTPSPDRLPAAIMGDTITVLSNQCLTGRSVNSAGTVTNYLGTPAAQIDCGLPSNATGSAVDFGNNYYTVIEPTAVNAAFLSSIMRSCGNLGVNRSCGGGAGSYSGGINNYMRMLEDWQLSQYFNYSGSFVSLGAPLEYSGAYLLGGTFYNIPVRNYNFDTNFNNFSLLPPLSPRAIYLQQDVFKRAY